MSADAWRTCPKCKANRVNKAEGMYGKVPEQEYLKMLEAADDFDDNTFREDYAVYMDEDGGFLVSYYGQCTECGFMHEFNHTDQLELD